MAVSAVERKLQIVSEAATRLGKEAERLCPATKLEAALPALTPPPVNPKGPAVGTGIPTFYADPRHCVAPLY